MIVWRTVDSRHYYSKHSEFARYSVAVVVAAAMRSVLKIVAAVAVDAYYLLGMALVVTRA